jgi:hypothetical protein
MSVPVEDLTRVLGRMPPRRATLGPESSVVEKTRPDEHEIEALSALCEIARRAAGLPIFPRDVADLVAVAVETNCPGAWGSVFTDIKSGATSADVTAACLERHSPELLVRDLVEAGSPQHLMWMCQLLAVLLPRGGDVFRARCGAAMGSRLSAIVDATARLGMRRDVRDAALTGLGKLFDLSGVAGVRVADELLRVLDIRADDAVVLFVHAPIEGLLAARPQLPAALVARAATALPAARYAHLALLVRLVKSAPGCLAGLPVAELVVSTLAGYMATRFLDARVALVCAVLAADAEPCAGLSAALARALELSACTVIRASTV